ncbi:MAG: hypothetical protein ACE5EY_12320 [Anaerolineae bacterium]
MADGGDLLPLDGDVGMVGCGGGDETAVLNDQIVIHGKFLDSKNQFCRR